MVPEDRDAADGGESSDGGSSDRLARRHHDGVDGADPHPASTLMIMVDGFEAVARARKRAKVLDQVSWVIVDTLRRTDMVYRNGESGFCAVLANTPEDQAFGAANRVRANVEMMPLLADAGITVTVGVAAGGDADLADTIARAERALSGRHSPNQVIRADD